MVGHGADHFAAVGRGGDIASVVAQIFRDQRPRLAIVLDDEDIGCCLGHADLLSVIRGSRRRIFVSRCFQGGLGQYGATGEGAGEKASLIPLTLRSSRQIRMLDTRFGAIMTSISAASAQSYQSPLQKLQDELLSEVKSGKISSSDQDALASALTDIYASMQSSRASDQAGGTRPSPGDLKSKIDDLIDGEVSSGKLTSDQATELQGVFKAAFANGPGGAGGGPGGPGGAGGPPPGGHGGPPPSDSASSSNGSSSSTTSADDILKQFLQSLQDQLSASSSTSYGATGSSSTASSSSSFSALLIDYQS